TAPMFVLPVPGVPAATWRMNTALISAPLVPDIHTSANPVTGTEQSPLQPLQLTTGTTVTRASLRECEDQVPLGSAASPAATREATPWPIGPVVAPGSVDRISPTLTVQAHPAPRFCLNALAPMLPLLVLGRARPPQQPGPQLPLCNVIDCP